MLPMDALVEEVRVDESSGSELRAALARIAVLETEVRRLRSEQATQSGFEHMRIRDAEAWLVTNAMTRARGNVSRAARVLGLSRAALYRRLERHGLDRG